MNYNKIDLETVRSPRYDENIYIYGDNDATCFLCGKKTDKSLYVHYTTDGHLIDELNDQFVPNSQGVFPIGSECAQKLPNSFIIK